MTATRRPWARTTLRERTWGGRPVPALALWSGQRDVTQRDLRCTTGLRYDPPMRQDRYRGVLWARLEGEPGQGSPRFGVSPLAQRELMAAHLCFHCARTPSRTSAGTLYLLEQRGPVPEGAVTGQPPTCLRCVPHRLADPSRTVAAVRAATTRLWGVRGVEFAFRGGALEPVRARNVPFGDAALSRVVGYNLLRELRQLTPVPEDALAAQARTAAPLEQP